MTVEGRETLNPNMKVEVSADKTTLYQRVLVSLFKAAKDAITDQGFFSLALAGGVNPQGLV